MSPADSPRDFVTMREYERYSDTTEKRWQGVVDKLDQLAQIVSVQQVRLTNVEKAHSLQSNRDFTQGLTAAQVGAGCAISFGVALLSIFGGIISAVVVHFVAH